MLNNSSVLSSMTFCEIAPALHSCCLFLMPMVKTWTKIFKQKSSTWTWWKLSIALISKLCFKSSKDMVRKEARFFGLQITKVDDLKWSFWKVLSSNRPPLHREFLRGAYLVQFFLFSLFLLKSYCVYEEKDLGVVILVTKTWGWASSEAFH